MGIKLNASSKRILDRLEGCEVESLEFEGIVMISGGEIWRSGEEVTTDCEGEPICNEMIEELWQEYLNGEGIY